MLIIPAIDLRNGRCVRLEQGRKDAATVYDRDPMEVARSFEADGAQFLHIVDLDAAFGEINSPNRKVAKRIFRSVNIPAQFGGGMRTPEDVERMIAAGASRVIIGTIAAESPQLVAELVDRFSADRIVVGIDARGDRVRTRGWEAVSQFTALDLARTVAKLGIERIIFTDVSRDGMLSGPNLEQTRLIADQCDLKITVSGGVSSLDDLTKIRESDDGRIDSVIIGKALYEGRFTLRDCLAVAR
jgi:phosphoribosylformimino-5-aminoimidazole carboxamide ribotide isomerase